MSVPNNKTHWEYTPAVLGLEDKNMKSASTYSSNMINGRNLLNMTAIVDITETGAPGNGAATLTIDVYDIKESTVLYSIDLVTAIDTKTDGAQCLMNFGPGVTAAVAAASGSTGTLGTDADLVKNLGPFKLKLEVTTQNDGTTSTASVTMLAEKA